MQSILTPGIYRLSELEELLGRTRKTIEKYIERFGLNITEVEYCGRNVRAVALDQRSITLILKGIGEYQDSILKGSQEYQDPTISTGNESPRTPSEIDARELWEQLKSYQEEIRRLDVDNARLIAKAEVHEQLLALKDEAIEAKNEAIQSLKASMVVLERAKNQLESERLMLENKQAPALVYEPVRSDLNKPKSFWGKVFGKKST